MKDSNYFITAANPESGDHAEAPSSDIGMESRSNTLPPKARGESGVDSDLSDSEAVEVESESNLFADEAIDPKTSVSMPDLSRESSGGGDSTITDDIEDYQLEVETDNPIHLKRHRVHPEVHLEFIRCLGEDDKNTEGDDHQVLAQISLTVIQQSDFSHMREEETDNYAGHLLEASPNGDIF